MPSDGLKTASSLTAQLITVSSGLLAFTVTFAEKFTPKDHVIAPPLTLGLSWIAFAVSILAGFWTLMAITGTLDELDAGKAESNPGRTNMRIPALIMFGLFTCGVVLLIAAGWTIAGPRLRH